MLSRLSVSPLLRIVLARPPARSNRCAFSHSPALQVGGTPLACLRGKHMAANIGSVADFAAIVALAQAVLLGINTSQSCPAAHGATSGTCTRRALPQACRWASVARASSDSKPSTDSSGLPSAPPLTTTSEGSGDGSSGDGPGDDDRSSQRTWRNTVDDIVTIAAALAISLVVRTCVFKAPLVCALRGCSKALRGAGTSLALTMEFAPCMRVFDGATVAIAMAHDIRVPFKVTMNGDLACVSPLLFIPITGVTLRRAC